MEGRKRVLLIGANGFVGQELTKELIKHFNVKALIRSPPKFGINSIFLKFANGDASSKEVLEANLQGIDLVVSSFGVSIDNPDGQMKKFAQTLTGAMEKKGVKRLVWIGGAGTLSGAGGQPLWQSTHYPEQYKKISEDHFNAYHVISSSGLDWTILCPPKVTPGANEEKYKVFEENVGEGFQFHVKVGHLASLATKIAKEESHNKKRVGVCDE